MNKHFLTICIFSALVFGFVACNSDDNTPVEQTNLYAKYQGKWSGTYTGDGNGTWTATFDNNGKAVGSLVSGGNTFNLSGEVAENGEINAEYKSGSAVVGTMTGTLTDKTGSGTWDNTIQNLNGTWTGTKN